jgi:hypothetical protein
VIWELARKHACVLVTKDDDFPRLSVLHGAPPLVIWLCLGGSFTASFNKAPPLRRLLGDGGLVEGASHAPSVTSLLAMQRIIRAGHATLRLLRVRLQT